MTIEIADSGRLPDAAARFIEAVGSDSARVFAFHGPMGAGKTTFIAEVVRRLGSADEASSPTFSIINQYDTALWGTLYHFDCYRLDSEADAEEVGAEDYFYSGHPCLVEWPERIEALLPPSTVHVSISVDPDGARRLTIHDSLP